MSLVGSSDRVAEADTDQVPAVPGAPSPPEGADSNSNGAGAFPDVPTPVPNRLQRLAEMVDRARRGRSDRDIRKIMHLVGMAVLVFGFVAILIGWYGAAHSPYQFQEIPYLISGGLLGVALVIGGGMLVRSAWSLRQIEEMRRNTGAIVRSVEALENALRVLNGEAEPDDDADAEAGDRVHEEVRP